MTFKYKLMQNDYLVATITTPHTATLQVAKRIINEPNLNCYEYIFHIDMLLERHTKRLRSNDDNDPKTYRLELILTPRAIEACRILDEAALNEDKCLIDYDWALKTIMTRMMQSKTIAAQILSETGR